MNSFPGLNLPPPDLSINQVRNNFRADSMGVDWLCYADTNVEGLLVRAPLDAVEAILVEGGGQVERNVYDGTAEEPGLLVLQLQHQNWTVITDAWYLHMKAFKSYAPRSWNLEVQAQTLSGRLQTRTILFGASDTGGTTDYSVWDRGILVEEVKYDEGEDPNQEEEIDIDSPPTPCRPQVFNSQLRDPTAQEIEDVDLLFLDFLESQQVSWLSLYALTRLCGIRRADFVRLDLVKVKIFPSPSANMPPPHMSLTDALSFDEEYEHDYRYFLSTDRAEGLLVKTPLNTVETLLVESGGQLQQDVYGGTTAGEGLLVFQLQQQDWSVITDAWFLVVDTFESHSPSSWNWENQGQHLSAQLQTRIILFGISEDGAKIRYSVWDNGILVEELKYNSNEALNLRLTFNSQLRQVEAQSIQNPHKFTFDFLESQEMSWLTLYTLTRFYGVRREDFVSLDFVSWHD
jgi:hypothetical protein